MLQNEFVDAPYVVDQLLGNAGFERKVKHFVSAFVNEGRKRSECSENLRLILEKNGIGKVDIIEILGVVNDIYRDAPLLNK